MERKQILSLVKYAKIQPSLTHCVETFRNIIERKLTSVNILILNEINTIRLICNYSLNAAINFIAKTLVLQIAFLFLRMCLTLCGITTINLRAQQPLVCK